MAKTTKSKGSVICKEKEITEEVIKAKLKEWTNIGWGPNVIKNDELLIETTKWLYKHVGLEEPKKFYFTDSVFAAQDLCARLLKPTKPSWYELSVWLNFADSNWLACYEVLRDHGKISKEEDVEIYLKGIKETDIFDCIQHQDFVIFIRRPLEVHLDEENRLHNADGPAVLWKDGNAFYSWRNIPVRKHVITDPDKVTKSEFIKETSEFIKETNVEVHRCYIEKLGPERLAKILGTIEIDKKYDKYKNIQILYRSKDKDNVINDYLWFVDVTCPSTKRRYFTSVPTEVGEKEDVEEARAWTFGKDKENFNPSVET